MKYSKLLIVAILSLFLVGCGAQKTTKPIYITKTEKVIETVHDTIIKIEKDSAKAVYVFKCPEKDSKPPTLVPVKKKTKAGAYISPPKVQIQGNVLTIDCEAKAQELFKTWKTKYTKNTTEEQVPIYIPYQMKWWQKTLMWTGGIAILLIIIGIAGKFINPLKI